MEKKYRKLTIRKGHKAGLLTEKMFKRIKKERGLTAIFFDGFEFKSMPGTGERIEKIMDDFPGGVIGLYDYRCSKEDLYQDMEFTLRKYYAVGKQ